MDFSFIYNPALDLLEDEDLREKLRAEFKNYTERAFVQPTTKSWKDYEFVPGFEPETAQYVYEKWEARKDDIIVASYPKTGTTWTKELCHQIISCKQETLKEYTSILNFFFSYLSYGPVAKYELMDRLPIKRRIMGSHLPAPLFNFEKFRKVGTKVIYVMRNPKDQAVSWYYFCKKQPFANVEPWKSIYAKDQEEFFDETISGKNPVLAKKGEGYLEHLKGWYEHRNDENVLFLVFEEMKENIQREIRRIGQFIGVDLTDEEVAQVVEKSSINQMKNKTDEIQTKFQLTRTGKVGEWKHYLTEAQSDLLDKKVQDILGGTGIKFVYDL